MPDLLLELLSEEIPARMQARAAQDLRRLVGDALIARGHVFEGARAFAGPRRLALHVAGLPARGASAREERRGPRAGAPAAAIEGFLKAAGLDSIDQAPVQETLKGAFHVAIIEREGRPTLDALAELLPGVIEGFPWPKSMRWGAASAAPRALRWVRPLTSIVAMFGAETEEPLVVPFSVGGIAAGDVTRGHRQHAPAPFRVRRLEDYEAGLFRAKVVLDAARRADIIRAETANLAFAQGLEVVADEALLAEVAGLVEWPVVRLGAFEERFLALPPEVIRATIRANQKCFVLARADGSLAPRFALTANQEAPDDGAAIVAGNERVVRARLSDALFFWDTDRAALPARDLAALVPSAERLGLDLGKPLDQRMAKLDAMGVVFHAKLGTQGQRVERIAALARELAPKVGADPDLAERAARLAKADLVTEAVGEFPELQGLMGRTYATAQGEDAAVARAIEEHYKPLGPSDAVPRAPVSVAVALADKLDTLIGFWAIGEKPTGSKDPYALRRASLGVIRYIMDNSLNVPISAYIIEGYLLHLLHMQELEKVVFLKSRSGYDYVSITANFQERFSDQIDVDYDAPIYVCVNKDKNRSEDNEFRVLFTSSLDSYEIVQKTPSINEMLDIRKFLHDRLKVQLREQGARHDLVDAVLALPGRDGGPQDDLLLIARRVEALGAFLDGPEGAGLLAGARRAANILRIEEGRDGAGAFDATPDPALYAEGPERALAAALDAAVPAAEAAAAREDHAGALGALSALRAPVGAFFDAVTVNAPDPALRANRLRLLARLRAAARAVADLSRVEG